MSNNRYKILSTKLLEPRLINQAKSHGLEIVEQAAIEIEFIQTSELEDRVIKLTSLNLAVVLTSGHAVEAVKRILKDRIPGSWRIYCLEGRTLETVQQMFPGMPVLGKARDAQNLAETIWDEGERGPVIFFCGNRRREELPHILREAGLEVEEIVVYETQASAVSTDMGWDGILFFSPSAVESFFSVNVIAPTTICFAIGQTTAASLGQFTKNPIIVCPFPGRKQIISELIAHFHPTPTPL